MMDTESNVQDRWQSTNILKRHGNQKREDFKLVHEIRVLKKF